MAREFKGARHGLDDALTARLNRYCDATDKMASKVIVTALEQYLEAEERKLRRDGKKR